jgi:oxalate decarboxylase/phosphoglucose isomerase-like protein (cupin superfamily)
MLYGSTRITAVDADGRSVVRDTHEGDLWYFPTGIPHSIQGLGPDGGEFLLVFDDGNFSEYATVLLSDIAAHTPRDVRDERRREAAQRQTHHHGRPKLTDEAKTNVRSARNISGADSAKNLFSKRFKR